MERTGQDAQPPSQTHTERPWVMNGEAWERERQSFTRMEQRQHTNTTEPGS